MTHRPVCTPTPRVCALPGCDNPVSPEPNTPDRRYCGIAHRKAARKRRRSANATVPAPARSADQAAAPEPTAAPAPAPAAVFLAAGSAGSSVAAGSGSDSTTTSVTVAPRPPRVLAGAGTRGPNGEPGLTRHGYRRLVPEPRNRWYQRSGRPPFAGRGIRPEPGRRRRPRQLRGEPELWLSDAATTTPEALWEPQPDLVPPAPAQPAATPEPRPAPTSDPSTSGTAAAAASPAPAQSLTTPAPATTRTTAPTTAPPRPPAPRQPVHTPPVQPPVDAAPAPTTAPPAAPKPELAATPTPRSVPEATPEPKTEPAPTPAPKPTLAPAPAPAPAPKATPRPTPKPTLKPRPKPTPKPKPAPAPAPEPASTPAPKPASTAAPEPEPTPKPGPKAALEPTPASKPEPAEVGPKPTASSTPSAPPAARMPSVPAPTAPPVDPPTVPIPVAKLAESATAPIPTAPPAAAAPPVRYPAPFPPAPYSAPYLAPVTHFGPAPFSPFPGPVPYPAPAGLDYPYPAGLDYPYPAPAGFPGSAPYPAAPVAPEATSPAIPPSTWRTATTEAWSATVSSLQSACAASASACRRAASSAWRRTEAAARPVFAAPARRFGERWSAQPSSPERTDTAGAAAADSDGHDMGAPLGRGVIKAQRRAQKKLARQEAAAVLAGTLLPGEAPPAKRGRKRGAPRPLPAPVIPAADASQALWGQMREALLAALHSLANNRLRSVLTTIGIVAGVAAVIVMVAMGNGMRQQYQEQTDRFANQINIAKAKMGAGIGASRNLTDADVRALSDHKHAPAIGEISETMGGDIAVYAGQQRARAQLVGAQLNFARLTDRKLVAGTWFTPAQMDAGDRAVILGPEEVNLLYGDVDPNTLIGQTVRLSHSDFKVQGVLETNGQADNAVIVPFNAARAHLTGNQNGKVDQIILKSTSLTNVDEAVSEATEILDKQHNIRDAATRDYNITTFTQDLKQSLDFINYLTWFVIGIAAISLFVGGVGVANIMLVSVTERTREIGIRKAVGAKTSAILRQFLSEAVILTGLGGLAGVALGLAVTEAGILILPKLGAGGPNSQVPIPIMSVGPVLIAFLVSLVIGVLAGGYPAHRAARLRPIEALRFE